MTKAPSWNVTIDRVTDALVRSHLARTGPAMTLDTFVKQAVTRELDRLALFEHEEATRRPRRMDDMWEIIIPLRPKP